MTTSQITPFLSELAAGESIPPNKLAFFQARLRNRLFHFVLVKFLEQERINGLTKANLARRIGRKPEVISRLLGAPGNWTLDTVSDLLLGIAAEELEPRSSSLLDRHQRNFAQAEWLKVGQSSGILGARAQTGSSSIEVVTSISRTASHTAT